MRQLGIFLTIVIGLTNSYAQFAHDLRVLLETQTSAVIEFSPLFLGENGQRLTQEGSRGPSFFGALIDAGKPGDIVVRYRGLTILLPSQRYSLQVLVAEFQENAKLQAPRYPELRGEELGFVQTLKSTQHASSSSVGRESPVEIADIAQFGTWYSGTLKFYPIHYEGGGQSARVYSRIVIRIEFDPAPDGFSVYPDRARPQVSRALEGSNVSVGVSDSPLSQGTWYRLDLRETGIYKLDREFFTRNSISIGGGIQTVRLFGNGGEALPEDLSATRPNGLEEIPRLVVDQNRNGQFDAEDYVLFYGKSPRGWKYDRQQKMFSHYINAYTETSSYFLTVGGAAGKGMDSTASTNLPGAFTPSDFQGKLFVEEELFNHGVNGVSSGRQWLGRSFDEGSRSQTYTNLLPGIVTTKAVLYRYILLSRSTTVDTFTVFENNQQLGTRVFTLPIDVTSVENDKQYRTPVISAVRTGDYPNDRSVLRFTFGPGNSGALGWIDWFEILYRQRYEAVADFLLFTSPDTTALVEYNLSRFSSRDVVVFDVSNHQNVRRIVNLTFHPADATTFKFQVQHTAGDVREFIAVGPNGFKSPLQVTRVPNSNLHGITDGADFIIITPTEFTQAANRLKAHRERPGIDYLKTLVVNIESVFNEFSSGMLDPMAIRDFLKYARTNWPIRPSYVLLLGDGSYDYKDNLNRKQKENWIPPYESLNSINQIETYSSDDHFVQLDVNNPRVSLAIGRLPVRSATEADNMITKIINYETTAPFGSWRNRITFVADDGLTSRFDEGSLHTSQAEFLAQTYTPTSFEKRKIYIVEYPTVTSATGRRKPDANKAIVDAINNGTLIINYTGHGNTKIWAHERIFGDEEDFPKLTNFDRHCLLVAATCDFARWDYPQDRSAGEKILTDLHSGAIAVVTSIRVVYSFENSLFNNTLFSFALVKDSLGRPPRLGDAMKSTKQLLFSINDLKYHLLGDPTMRLAIPRAPAVIDSVRGMPTTQIVSLPTLGRIPIRGQVKQVTGAAWSDFNGRALIEVFDSKRRMVVPEWGNYAYEVSGSLLYRGEISVTNGAFRGEFPIPKDVSYDRGAARISIYAWNTLTDGMGFTENVRIEGTDSTVVADTTGPEIQVYLDSESFRAGDVVKPDASLIVKLFDVSGMNTSTAGIGHRLEATLSSRQQPIDLTEYYRGHLDTYQSGEVVYPLTGLPEGRHSLSVQAWDIHNNATRMETYFDVRASSEESIFNVLNFPNPFSGTTSFTFQRATSEPIDVEINIYTIAGRLVERLEAPSVVDRFVQVPWNGRDRDGNELANGVYFYRVITRSVDRQRTTEVLGKLSILR